MKFLNILQYLLALHLILVNPVLCEGKNPRDVYCFIEALHRDDLQTVETLYNSGAIDLENWQKDLNQNHTLSGYCWNSFAQGGLLFSTFIPCPRDHKIATGCPCQGPLPDYLPNRTRYFRQGRCNCIRFLIEHGMDVNTDWSGSGCTLLMLAAQYHDDILINYLLTVPGVLVNAIIDESQRNPSATGYTALLYAFEYYCHTQEEVTSLVNVVRSLAAAGADVNVMSKRNRTPLIAALGSVTFFSGNQKRLADDLAALIEILQILLDAGADMDKVVGPNSFWVDSQSAYQFGLRRLDRNVVPDLANFLDGYKERLRLKAQVKAEMQKHEEQVRAQLEKAHQQEVELLQAQLIAQQEENRALSSAQLSSSSSVLDLQPRIEALEARLQQVFDQINMLSEQFGTVTEKGTQTHELVQLLVNLQLPASS